MGQIFDTVSVNGANLYTIFDSGSENNYITQEAVSKAKLESFILRKSLRVSLGGERQKIDKYIALEGKIEANSFNLLAYVIPELGIDKRTSTEIELLFGAHDIQRWNIRLDLENEKLDLSRFVKEFIEFFNHTENNKGMYL